MVLNTLEGTVGTDVWFHYDLANDVLYLSLSGERETPSYSEETTGAGMEVRRIDDDELIGMTIVGWGKRRGLPMPCDISQIAKALNNEIEDEAKRFTDTLGPKRSPQVSTP